MRSTILRSGSTVRKQPSGDQHAECIAREGTQRPGDEESVVFELCSGLFASMPRSDQRMKAIHYVRGLLGAEGRKSIRNIATLLGGDAAEQSLHHFISSSTWDWTPVRRALAQHIERVSPPQAYVVHPMIIPKAGETSVGVERRFVPELGQVINAQQAVGVWAAAHDWSSPCTGGSTSPTAGWRTRTGAARPPSPRPPCRKASPSARSRPIWR